ncbi:DUF6708 domain-containing protein [Iodobacter ciconiae]|uniref:DUF6708 domain-containing protein n=1 Tax=Iodobacter ciconiae TaxID=2496266 RepID=A0A3S8ZQ26_9NEIS|nr:DUF6708 domain-containing protein [Iodobacter ciconiae]AZN35565.1 hypothetical protein EJO50_03125 [Iodobacter ciconiae]
MYYLEWINTQSRQKHKPGSASDVAQKNAYAEIEEKRNKAIAEGVEYQDIKDTEIWESRSERVDDNHAIYAKTGSYIDVCTYNDDKRGLITPLIFCFLYGIIPWWLSVFEYTSSILLTGLQPDGALIDGEAIAVIGIDLLALPFLTYIFFRYLFKFWRLEAFTMRRLIVRFNRKTRQVYFLRPSFLGGTVIYDWADIGATVPKDMENHEGIGGMLMLYFQTADTQNPHSNIGLDAAFVGNPCRDFGQLLSFWEYIRRFMEDGADAVPMPKRLRSKWPNPLTSILAVSRLNLPGGFDLGHSFLWLRIALTPLFVFWGVGGHYGSLMLSYEPRFPKALRVASGESELKSLLSMIAYNLFPVIYTAIGGWCAYAWYKDLDMQLPLRWLGWV